jgi:CBS domain-containing protein
MAHREVGSPEHVLLPVREVGGAPRVDCPRRGGAVLFSECQSCEHGTVVRLKGAAAPYLVCPATSDVPAALSLWPKEKVRAVMRPVMAVREGLSIEALVRTLIDENVAAAPVVDESGRPVGLVSRLGVAFDDIGWEALRDAALSSWPPGTERYDAIESEDDLYVHDLLRTRTVADVMTRDVTWVSPELSIEAAAEVMAKNGVPHVPVLDEGGCPIGMLSAFDLARWLADRR